VIPHCHGSCHCQDPFFHDWHAHIAYFVLKTGNASIATPYCLPTALSYLNGVFNLFWTTSKFEQQAGNTAVPSQTIWIVALIYSRSYTVLITMVILPYTRAAWRVKAYLCFIFTDGVVGTELGLIFHHGAASS
jgi:hypothetical protein